jgi:hypothetical protein
VDLIYSKIDENDWWWRASPERNDEDLYGVNTRYDLAGLGVKGSAELYYFARYDREEVYRGASPKKDTCHTIGTLISGEIIENLTGSLEYAYQFGDIQVNPVTGTEIHGKRRAWALQTGLNYAFPTEMSPTLGVLYTYLSGDKNQNDQKFKAWDPMFEDQTLNIITNAIFPHSSTQVINVKGSIKPTEDLTLSANYGYYRLAQRMDGLDIPGVYGPYRMAGKKSLGSAVDLSATYDYTEDVQFGLTFGYFNPGKAFDKDAGYKKDATQIIGSMKVTF